jgi:ABC-2 type transport system permease protein
MNVFRPRGRLYAEVARSTFRRVTTYRAATFAGVVTNTVFGFILAYVLVAVFNERGSVGGFDTTDAVTYVFVTQGLLMVVGVFGNLEMAERIKTGDVAVDLCRPYDFQGWWLSVHYGKAPFYFVFRGLPPYLIGALVFHLQLPPDVPTAVAFVVSTALAVGVAGAYGFILQSLAFWLIDVRGPNQIGWITAQFLAGTYIPLVLFPAWLEAIARVLPFASMIQFPVEVFLGKHTGANLAGVFALQITWLVALVAIGRVLLARATQKLVIQGG